MSGGKTYTDLERLQMSLWPPSDLITLVSLRHSGSLPPREDVVIRPGQACFTL